MFRIISDNFDIDELYDDVSEDIKTIADYSARYVVRSGPVWTGLFRGNWNVSIDVEYNGAFLHEDKSGMETLYKMQDDIEAFSLRGDKKIYIQNNVVNLETGEDYAQTVGWDSSGRKAESVLNGAIIIGAQAVE